MKIWTESSCKPYFGDQNKFIPLLDVLNCHKQEYFLEEMQSAGTSVKVIPYGYTYVLQPCGVDMIKPIKHGSGQYCIR